MRESSCRASEAKPEDLESGRTSELGNSEAGCQRADFIKVAASAGQDGAAGADLVPSDACSRGSPANCQRRASHAAGSKDSSAFARRPCECPYSEFCTSESPSL